MSRISLGVNFVMSSADFLISLHSLQFLTLPTVPLPEMKESQPEVMEAREEYRFVSVIPSPPAAAVGLQMNRILLRQFCLEFSSFPTWQSLFVDLDG